MNNPLETVTQAVNSLLTALKLPDESAKANQILGEMSFPQFSRLLPYRDYNQESGLFVNDATLGFMLEATPINGASETVNGRWIICCAPNCRAAFRCVST